MAIFKCKMCGGTLEVNQGESVGVCEYCGTKQTLPKLDDERKTNLYDRANHFRRNNDYDKAMGIYEQILSEDSTDAEAYWSLVLCKYGIEYVEDPATHKRVPTVNRAQYTSVFADEDYKSAIKFADGYQKDIYEAEAKAIDEIQKGILEISQKEEPFDVFICYKETGNDGRRTPDSVLATELYHELTREGFKVFFSRITLEDKLGTAYEPYIFAALNSAKVMVVLGTKAEHFNAVWVKNEWSRFLALIKAGARKTLIPAYKDMDPYDLPEEFSHLQAQDMSKLGFMNDLVRGVNKILSDSKKTPTVKETVAVGSGNANVAPLLKRAFMFLEDGDWKSADEYCEKVLDMDPENAEAYLGKLMAELQVRKAEKLEIYSKPLDSFSNYQKAVRYGDQSFKERMENYRLAQLYNAAVVEMRKSTTETTYKVAAALFKKIAGYRDTDELAKQCLEKAEECRKEEIYQNACAKARKLYINYQKVAIETFKKISGYKDVDERVVQCERTIADLKEKEKEEKIKREKEEELSKAKEAKKKKIRIISFSFLIIVLLIFFILLFTTIIPFSKYSSAKQLLEKGEYSAAIEVFRELEDSINPASKYKDALSYIESGQEEVAYYLLKDLDYQDSEEKSVQLMQRFIEQYSIYYPQTISASFNHHLGIRENRTVVATGKNDSGRCDIQSWKNIVAVAAGHKHSVGLKEDGTVVATGANDKGQCDVSAWKNIKSITAAWNYTIGLKDDGTVIYTGDSSSGELDELNNWTDIVAISTGGYHTVGLKRDGTVIAIGENDDGQCRVSGWKDIVAICAGYHHTIGLTLEGRVVAVGSNTDGECDVEDWHDVVAVYAGEHNSFGLFSDGTVIAIGDNYYGQCDVENWYGIKTIVSVMNHTVGLNEFGTVNATGDITYGQCDVDGLTGLKVSKY